MSEIRVLAFVNERLAPSATEITGARTRMFVGATPFCSIPADDQQRRQKSFTLVYKITLFNSDAALIRSNFTSFLLIFSLTSLAIILIRGPLLSRLALGTKGLFLACGWMLRCWLQVDTDLRPKAEVTSATENRAWKGLWHPFLLSSSWS